MDHVSDPSDDYFACVELACTYLDAIHEYGINQGDAAGLLVLHGLAMYARDTARSAASLWHQSQVLAAGALTRVVIEHAVLAQWVKVDPEVRGHLFLRQSEVERHRWFEVVLAANFDSTGPAHVALGQIEQREFGPKPKNVADEFSTVRNLFGATDLGRQMYLTYRNLSRFVHPSAITLGRYTSELPPGGSQLHAQLQVEQDPESIAFYLATATAMSAVPYLDAINDPTGAAVRAVAKLANVPTTLGVD